MPMIVASVPPIKSANKQIKFLTTLTILRACITIILNATVTKPLLELLLETLLARNLSASWTASCYLNAS